MMLPPSPLIPSDIDRRPYLQANDQAPNRVIGKFWLLLFVGALFVAGPYAQFHAVYFGAVGFMMLFYPPSVALPRVWWILAGVFVVAGLAQFLPAAWFHQPAWRAGLEALGLETGTQVAIQVKQSIEKYVVFVAMLFTGLWFAGQRASGAQLRLWALIFSVGVAVYAVLALAIQFSKGPGAIYGFFPNRNHTATLLAMGSLCGLGCVMQALREKRYPAMAVALVATAVSLWALGAWSISRAGILIFAVGCVLWLPMLGKRYLGSHALKVLGLIAFLGVGVFLIADSSVKKRISETSARASAITETGKFAQPAAVGRPALVEHDVDFRVPIAKDTLKLIDDFKWTGVGAGQFRWIFPQYQHLSTVVNDSACMHPESDWLWMASEIGVIGTAALAILVVVAFWKARGSILRGRDRSVRSACMVAALLVPLHGIIDVPGHRIVLAWSAVFLFCLCLSSTACEHKPAGNKPPAKLFQIGGVVLLLLAGYLASTSITGGPKLASEASTVAFEESKRLHAEDLALQKIATDAGEDYQPATEDDLIEKALRLLEEAKKDAQLDPILWRQQLALVMVLDDREERSAKIRAIEQALEPAWVMGSLRQGALWVDINEERSLLMFQEALRRAERLDKIKPDTGMSRKNTLVWINRIAKGKPSLEAKVLTFNGSTAAK